jgi:two-component system response regulator DesR
MSPARRDGVEPMLLVHRRARMVLVALHLLFAGVAPILTGWGSVPGSKGDPRVVVLLAGVAFGLQLEHSLAAADRRQPAAWPWSFAALCTVVYVPMVWFSFNWASMQWFVVASAAMLLPRALAVVFIAGPTVGTGIWQALDSIDVGATAPTTVYGFVYWVAGLGIAAACLWGAVELVRAVDLLFATRAQLAELAVESERKRLSRDLHDLLGQTLTAVSLKGDLARALIGSDPRAAEAEVRSLTSVARDAVTSMRSVTHGHHRPSLTVELDGAVALLAAAGVATDVDVAVGELSPPEDEMLGWAVREGVTNLLRHSKASRCSIAGRVDDNARVVLEIVNDGAERPDHGGQGLAGLADRAAALGGDVRARHARDSYHLLVRLRERRTMIRVLVAEDMHMIRGALVALLSRESDIDVVAELERGDEVVDAAKRLQPDVAVLDIDMPGLDGLSAAALLHEEVPACEILVLTGLTQPSHLLRALQVHVRGFMVKDAPAGTLADGIRRVAQGQRVIDPDLVAAALDVGSSPLTARETDVLREAEAGVPTEEVAKALSLSPATVRNYLSNAITKLGARNRIEAIRIARDAGWL